MLNAQDYFDKHLIRLGNELRDLWRRRHIRVPLDEPIQRGWRRFHVLTAKAERRADKDVLLALLEFIGTVKLRNSPDFRNRRGRGRRRRFVEIEQPLHELSVGEWNWRRLPEEWKPYFRQEKRCHFRVWHDALIFASPYVFELKLEPNWITETYVCDPAVEQRIAEIEGWLRHRNAMHRLDWLCDNSNRWRWRDPQRQDLLDRIARRELRDAMRNPSEVDPAASTRRIRISFRRIIFIFPGVAQQKRHSAQNGASAGANPAAGTTLAPVAQRRGRGLKPRSVPVRIRPGAPHLNARVAQQKRHRLQNSDSASATLAVGTNGT